MEKIDCDNRIQIGIQIAIAIAIAIDFPGDTGNYCRWPKAKRFSIKSEVNHNSRGFIGLLLLRNTGNELPVPPASIAYHGIDFDFDTDTDSDNDTDTDSDSDRSDTDTDSDRCRRVWWAPATPTRKMSGCLTNPATVKRFCWYNTEKKYALL
jgi:hypothetical protein